MRHKTKYKRLILLTAICLMMAVLFIPSLAISEVSQTPMPTITPTPTTIYSREEQFRVSILSLAAVLSALTLIVVTIGKVFKPVREWFIGWMRKSLRIVDANKTIDDRFEDAEKQVASESHTRQQEYAVMTAQNDSIEETLSEVLKVIGEISKRLGTLEEGNIALIRDGITKTFYAYCHQETIPIHEKENMGKMYDIYRKYNANSYVSSLMKAMDEWDVFFGNDPSCDIKH